MTSPYWEAEQVVVYLKKETLRTGKEQVMRLFRSGKIKTVKDGRRYLTTEGWVDAYLTKRGSNE